MKHFLRVFFTLCVLGFLGVSSIWTSQMCDLKEFSCNTADLKDKSAASIISTILKKVNQ